jgi:hypothetical protein
MFELVLVLMLAVVVVIGSPTQRSAATKKRDVLLLREQ